ncbi:hypothetical protein D9757_011742 [Collybiopsis confluens]|uniref:Uncharacterized protein n=1 Tax=Collybiopsis confluens TaxID=2823264 RepID=A0A8H5LK83_9AGAR|nr:hypothetical protein D9757_011742 [Collybiopsis confluens]
MSSADQDAILNIGIYLCQHILADIVSSGAFFGFYLMAFVMTVKTYRIDGRARKIILAGLLFSFILCCWDLLLSKLPRLLIFIRTALIDQSSRDMSINMQTATDAVSGWNSALTWPFNINLLIGDSIVCWRASAIWNGRKPVKNLLILLMIANAALDIADALMDDITTAEFVILDSVSSFFSFGVNFLATVMITLTAWNFYWKIRDFSYCRVGINLRKLLLFLIESGSIFCLVQLVYALIQLPSLESNRSTTLAIYLIGCLCNISAVLYPLTVIAFIDSLSSSPVDTLYSTQVMDTQIGSPSLPQG